MTEDLRVRALRLLARRDYTRAELARKLEDPGVEAEVAVVLDGLERDGYLSDARFAEAFVAARGGRHGLNRLRHDLLAKGVPAGLITDTLDALKPTELDRAREVWSRRFHCPPTDSREYARQARFLQARGFPAETIRQVLRSE